MNNERMMNILLAPHTTEKTTSAGSGYKSYAFRVRTDATKPEIKKAVEGLFEGVSVRGVTVSNMKPIAKQRGQSRGFTKAWKKAYVTLSKGEIQLG
jgi:large subunit ribosomal protein L23